MSSIIHLWFILSLAGPANLGVQGEVFEVEEPDLRLVMMAQMAEQDFEPIRDRYREQARNFTANTPDYLMPPAEQNRQHWVDPSVTVQEDIEGLVLDDETGRWRWGYLHRAGKQVNPLDYRAPDTWLYFVDGRVEWQREIARDLVTQYPARIKAVFVRGDPGRFAAETGYPAYAVQEWHFDLLGVANTPAVAGVHPDRPDRFLVAEFAEGTATADIEEVLPW